MKVGILTFHNAHNYGAVLQAYALRTKLRMLGHEVKILNYRNQHIENAYRKKLEISWKSLSVRHPRSIPIFIREYWDIKYAQSSWEKRCEIFEEFIYEVILEKEEREFIQDDFTGLDLDVFICGSDQIWTDYLTGGLDKAYFLDFSTQAKKISYGASKVNSIFSDQEKRFFQEKLRDFHAVSVREAELAKNLSAFCQRKVETVLDPTLLLSKEDYLRIEKVSHIERDYVLAYFLIEDNRLMDCAKKIAKQLNIQLIEIHYYKQRYKEHHNQIADCGPSEFLALFHHAKYVVTNSFHGVVFSIIYEKKFYAVYDVDSRKNNLLELLHLNARHIQSADEIDSVSEIDYDNVNIQLEKAKKHSVEFLQMNLRK